MRQYAWFQETEFDCLDTVLSQRYVDAHIGFGIRAEKIPRLAGWHQAISAMTMFCYRDAEPLLPLYWAFGSPSPLDAERAHTLLVFQYRLLTKNSCGNYGSPAHNYFH